MPALRMWLRRGTMDVEPFGTRSTETMVAYAARASAEELRAVRAEAERDGDRELVRILTDELQRRGLDD